MVTILMSYRFADKAIADVIGSNLARWGFDSVFHATSPEAGPQIGEVPSDELEVVLKDVDVVILVHTVTDEDWSWCVWLCGLATHPRQADTTPIVFQCSGYDAPREFAQQVNVDVDIEGIRSFTKHLHRNEDFFRGRPAFRPRISDEHLDELGKNFYEDLRRVTSS